MKKVIRLSVEDFENIVRLSSSPIEAIREIKKHTVDISRFAKWEGTWDYSCSECGGFNDFMTPHCPHCGAKMKNGREDL